MALDVEASDVVRIVLQFCKENNLTQTYAALAEETQCTLNTVDSVEGFLGDIRNGRWDLVLPQVATMRLPKRKLEDLYEQVAVETMESNEVDAARALLRESVTMTTMRAEQPERHARLERALERAVAQRLDAASAYPDGSSREKRRAAVARALESEVSAVPPSRLLALLGQALKWQKHLGSLKPGDAFDVFRGEARAVVDEEERYPTDLSAVIELGKKNHAEAVAASPDGRSVAVGSSDGFVELYDWDTGKLRMDLTYQAESLLMMHDDAVLAVAFSLDGDMLASGSRDGKIKVWRVSTGACPRKFDRAHAEGVTCVSFSRDGSKELSGSFDGVVKIHGLKSGKSLKEMRGHTSFVNDAVFADDDALVVSGGSDGDVRVWLAPNNPNRTSSTVQTLFEPGSEGVDESSIDRGVGEFERKNPLVVPRSIRAPDPAAKMIARQLEERERMDAEETERVARVEEERREREMSTRVGRMLCGLQDELMGRGGEAEPAKEKVRAGGR